MSVYRNLYSQCNPQTIARTSNIKYIYPNIMPDLISIKPPTAQYVSKKQTPNKCDTGEKCENSNKGFSSNPEQWGPHLWYYLHTSAANYPQNPSIDEIEGMKQWVCSLAYTIPCKNCSKHYKSYIDKNRPHLNEICSDRDKLFKFFVDLHNIVNARNGKQSVSVDDAWKMYKQY
jgi:hypothetical protein